MQTLTPFSNSTVDEPRTCCCSVVGAYGLRSTTAQRAVSFARWFASIQ